MPANIAAAYRYSLDKATMEYWILMNGGVGNEKLKKKKTFCASNLQQFSNA